jgi:predicted DCC family thiol-disulfide oxidoreductase YuxK
MNGTIGRTGADMPEPAEAIEAAAPTTVYYNSACPVCDAGVCAMRDSLPAANVEWIDVHARPEVLEPLGLRLEDVRERLHLVDPSGATRIGADALAGVLSLSPAWRWLARPLQWPGLRTLAARSYNRFARLLYRWNRARGHW